MTTQLDLKVEPCGIIDLALGYISKDYVTYLQLPVSPWASLDYIFDLLVKVAVQYKTMHQQIPIIFIDGCDVLAKSNPILFDRLVYLAKVLINDQVLHIVFISSEGTIIPQMCKDSRNWRY